MHQFCSEWIAVQTDIWKLAVFIKSWMKSSQIRRFFNSRSWTSPKISSSGACEALVTLGIIVLQANLELHLCGGPWSYLRSHVFHPLSCVPLPQMIAYIYTIYIYHIYKLYIPYIYTPYIYIYIYNYIYKIYIYILYIHIHQCTDSRISSAIWYIGGMVLSVLSPSAIFCCNWTGVATAWITPALRARTVSRNFLCFSLLPSRIWTLSWCWESKLVNLVNMINLIIVCWTRKTMFNYDQCVSRSTPMCSV